VERERIAFDLANVEKRSSDMQAVAASQQINRDYAEAVLAQYNEERRRLSDRLKLLDASLEECKR
jgi:hypothetical protein